MSAQTPEQMIEERLLTVPEACAKLRVSRWTLNRLMQSRQLRTIKIGSRRLVPASAIRKFIDQLARDGA